MITTAPAEAPPAVGGAAPEHIGRVDGVRGLAALGVLVFHVASHARWETTTGTMIPTAGDWVARLGNYGVAVFFVLSGMLLYRPFVRAHLDGQDPPSTAHFFVRRLARIMPAYWLVLTAVIAFGLAPREFTSWASEVAHFALLQNYGKDAAFLFGLGVAWTLSIELSFYLLLPLVAAIIRNLPGGHSRRPRRRLRVHLAGIAMLMLLTWAFRLAFAMSDTPPPGTQPKFWVINYFDWFGLGMLLAVAHVWDAQQHSLPRWLVTLSRSSWLCWLFAFQLYWVCVELHLPNTFDVIETRPQYALRFIVQGLSATLILLPLVVRPTTNAVTRFLDWQPIVFLGTISYGVYLWHTAILALLDRNDVHPPFVTLLVITLVTTGTIATLSYVLVERHVIALARRVTR